MESSDLVRVGEVLYTPQGDAYEVIKAGLKTFTARSVKYPDTSPIRQPQGSQFLVRKV